MRLMISTATFSGAFRTLLGKVASLRFWKLLNQYGLNKNGIEMDIHSASPTFICGAFSTEKYSVTDLFTQNVATWNLILVRL